MSTTFEVLEVGKYGTLYTGAGSTATDWIGYYLPNAAASGQPPCTLDFDAAWTKYWGSPIKTINGGCYLVLTAKPPTGTADALNTLLATLNSGFPGAYRYLLWLSTSTTGPLLNVVGSLAFAQLSGSVGTIVQTQSVWLGTLGLTPDLNTRLSAGSDGHSIVLSQAGTARPRLMQTLGQPTEVGQITSPVTIALAGPGAGGCAMQMTLSVYGQSVQNDFASLGVGVQYSYAQNSVVKSQLFPILGLPAASTTFPFTAILDPLNATNEALTRFTFQGTAQFSTALRTTTGIALTLTPVTGNAGMSLAPARVTAAGRPGQLNTYYASLAGAFSLGVDAAAPSGQLPLLCGMSGLESVAITPGTADKPADVVVFHPGQPAFAPSFPPRAVSLEQPGQAGVIRPALDTTMTTSWVSLQAAAGLNPYLAAPQGAPMFGAATPVLGFLPFAGQATGTATSMFPLVAYPGVVPTPAPDGFDPSLLTAFEQSVLSPTRRSAMSAPPTRQATADVSAGNNQTTTPQGFLVTLGAGSSWASMLLAQTVGTGNQTLSFAPVPAKVQAAFTANQLFLVGTAAAWDSTEFANQISIEGWPFSLATGVNQSFGSYSNVLIAKFCHGTLRELVKDPHRWTDAGDFNNTANNELLAVSQWLQSYFDDAAASNDPAFEHFNTIADQDGWQGILALRVDVPLDELPPEVGALRAGLPQSQFYAHHLGIEVNKVSLDGGLSVAGNSSLFGLIDYLEPVYGAALAGGADPGTPISPTPGLTYDFQVLRLLVVFANSEVKAFQSTSQVTVNQWFGDAVLNTRLGSGSTITNSIVIDGVLQRHDGQPLYLFTSAADTVFDLDSNVLSSVEVLSTTLTTLSDSATGPSNFRFTFAGMLNLAALAGLDLFSFGSANAGGAGGLAYSELYLDLSFDPAAAQPRVFTLNPSRIGFDTSVSTARAGSLFASMPLVLRGLASGGAAGPTGQGYLNVSMPGVGLSSLGDQWYGLSLDFELGGPGALAADVGWTAGLLLAWGVGSARNAATARVAVGLQLPGAGGQSGMLSLQGVLKLAIDQLELTQADGGAYLLRLTNIALHLLSLQFPPAGSTALYLFGDPGAKPGERSHVAWYAAYANPDKKAIAP